MKGTRRSSNVGDDESDDDELTPIIQSQSLSRQQVEQINKQRKLVQSVYGLNYVSGVSWLILILGLGSYILTVNVGGLESYFPFFVILCGELVVFTILYHITKLLVKALTNRDQKGDGIADLLVSNENKIPLVLFVVQLVAYFGFVHVLMVVGEILLFLGSLKLVSWVYCLIPIIILCGQTLITSIFTRLNHDLHTISALLILSFAVMIMMLEWSNINCAWYIISLPVLLLVGLWLLVLLHIFYMQQVGVIRLKPLQLHAFYLYLCGFGCAIVDLVYWRLNAQDYRSSILLSFLLVSLIFMAAAFSIDFFGYLDYHTRKMGSAIPTPLRQNSKGQWIADTAKKTRNYLILGYLESGSSLIDDDNEDDATPSSVICFLLSLTWFRKDISRQRRVPTYSNSSISSEEDGSHINHDLPSIYE